METQHKTVRLPVNLIKKISEKAKKENRSFGNALITILMEYFKKGK